MKVELTDIVFAVDSILVAVAMSPKTWVIITGGILGIIAMRLVIGQLLRVVRRYPALVDGAFIIIAWVAIKLLVEFLGPHGLHRVPHQQVVVVRLDRRDLHRRLPLRAEEGAGRGRRRGRRRLDLLEKEGGAVDRELDREWGMAGPPAETETGPWNLTTIQFVDSFRVQRLNFTFGEREAGRLGLQALEDLRVVPVTLRDVVERDRVVAAGGQVLHLEAALLVRPGAGDVAGHRRASTSAGPRRRSRRCSRGAASLPAFTAPLTSVVFVVRTTSTPGDRLGRLDVDAVVGDVGAVEA